MTWEHASLILAIAVLGMAISLLLRAAWLHGQTRNQIRALAKLQNDQQATWQSLLVSVRQESQRLESALRRTEAMRDGQRQGALRAIEELADSTALSNPNQMAILAEQFPVIAGSSSGDLFGENSLALSVAHLAEQGHPPKYIAERLGLSLGDVELMLSLKPA